MNEAAKLGFSTFVISASHDMPATNRLAHVRIIRCKHIMEALKAVLGTGRSRASLGTDDSSPAYDDEDSELVAPPF